MLSYTIRILLLLILVFFYSPSGDITSIQKVNQPAVVRPPRPIASLTIDDIREYYFRNPCYLPLLKDSAYWEPGKKNGFDYNELFNDSLSGNHEYRNRYIVGDFNVMDENGQNRMIQEIYPVLSSMKEFSRIPKDIHGRMEKAEYGTPEYDSLLSDIKKRTGDSSKVYINFLEKVWRYKMIPIHRTFSVEGNSLYYGGQKVVICEACGDTLIMQGSFAASARGRCLGIRYDANGNEIKYYYESLPTGRWRYYYAGLNIITSKNWDSQRKYEALDRQRDMELGGGNHLVTLYKDKDELPNFLLFTPTRDYPDAMIQNGIHEVSLRIMARGMLGTPNSIGCIRVSDFAAKFMRWWTPQYCKFFISYDDARYNKRFDLADSIFKYLPFKSQKEGDRFRRWMNENKPFEAKVLELDKTGDYRNGYILDAYYYLKDEYEKYLRKISGAEEPQHIFRYQNSPLGRVLQIERY